MKALSRLLLPDFQFRVGVLVETAGAGASAQSGPTMSRATAVSQVDISADPLSLLAFM
jgi:hypothetical protein